MKSRQHLFIDGDIARVSDFNIYYPNMVKVEEPIGTMGISAFVANPGIRLQVFENGKDR